MTRIEALEKVAKAARDLTKQRPGALIALGKALTELEATKPEEWDPDRPGWYWGYCEGAEGSPCYYLGKYGPFGAELWDGGRPAIIGHRLVPPPCPKRRRKEL